MTQTIGEQLREARSARQITLEQAAKATHIRQRFLEALENDQWELLPSKVQGRGFLRLYADFLGLNTSNLLSSNPTAPTTPPAPPIAEPIPQNPSSEPAPQPNEVDTTPPPNTPEGGLPVFIEIGQMLRQRRETISLSLVDVERYTRLRIRYLQALEDGRVYDLPSPVQGRGMLTNYADFLGLDSEEILNRFADGLQNHLAQARPTSPPSGKAKPSKKATTGWRRIITLEVLLAGAMILGLLVFAIWSSAQIAAQQRNQEPTPPDYLPGTGTAFIQEASPTPTATPPATLAAQATATIPITGNEPLQVYIVAHQRAWLQVVEDGKIVFSGRVVPNTAYPFSAVNQVEVYSGSASALQIYFNQTEVSIQGAIGEPLQLIFTAQGMLTPTPRFTATPTVTPQPTATLQPTPTLAAPTITPLIP